jgi:hypothetical protein
VSTVSPKRGKNPHLLKSYDTAALLTKDYIRHIWVVTEVIIPPGSPKFTYVAENTGHQKIWGRIFQRF